MGPRSRSHARSPEVTAANIKSLRVASSVCPAARNASSGRRMTRSWRDALSARVSGVRGALGPTSRSMASAGFSPFETFAAFEPFASLERRPGACTCGGSWRRFRRRARRACGRRAVRPPPRRVQDHQKADVAVGEPRTKWIRHRCRRRSQRAYGSVAHQAKNASRVTGASRTTCCTRSRSRPAFRRSAWGRPARVWSSGPSCAAQGVGDGAREGCAGLLESNVASAPRRTPATAICMAEACLRQKFARSPVVKLSHAESVCIRRAPGGSRAAGNCVGPDVRAAPARAQASPRRAQAGPTRSLPHPAAASRRKFPAGHFLLRSWAPALPAAISPCSHFRFLWVSGPARGQF